MGADGGGSGEGHGVTKQPLSEAAIAAAVTELDGWRHEDGALRRALRFADHPAAVAFLVRLAVESERLDHHAETHLVWAHVTLTLRTHDAGDRVTGLDVALARAVDRLVGG